MKVKRILLGCLAVLVGLYACGVQSTGRNGFLSDYSKLQKNPRYEGSRIYVNPETPLKNYSRFIVNPVQVRLSSIGAQRGSDSAKLQEMSQYAHQQFVTALENNGYPVVTNPGPGTLILRSALTEVAPSELRSRSYLMNISLGGASIEAEFVDALSGEVVVAVMESQRGKKVAADLNEYENAKNVVDRWANRLVQRLNEEHGK
ncbi:MAG: DUF3313 domain-containing protein [Nitrospinota bacterium]|nr:DUF3313 domain-containing protein [Nitrospinota bacterium]